jgi:hypothetical protein
MTNGCTSESMTKADVYRKRIAALTKKGKRRKASSDRVDLEKKIKALTDMADNEDWLSGQPTSKTKAGRDC